jgi:formate-dependent nitrite reductase membrane component NrfD
VIATKVIEHSGEQQVDKNHYFIILIVIVGVAVVALLKVNSDNKSRTSRAHHILCACDKWCANITSKYLKQIV